MLQSAELIVSFLLSEQYRGDLASHAEPIAGKVAGRDYAPAVPEREVPLVAAAAALAAGEAKYASDILNGSHAEDGVARALLVAATHLDLGRYPGGTGAELSSAHTHAQLRAALDHSMHAHAPAPDPDTHLVILVATELRWIMYWSRRIAEDSWSDDSVQLMREVYRQVEHLDVKLAELAARGAIDADRVRGYLRVCFEDAARRAGVSVALPDSLLSSDVAATDWVAAAHLALVRGDWALTPGSHPEVLGLRLGTGPARPPIAAEPDLAAADGWYTRAEELYTRACAPRGLAAVALRRAHHKRVAGDADGRDALREEALRRAEECGEHALVMILRIHRVIDRIEVGDVVIPAEIDSIVMWCRTRGSVALGWGLVRLLLVQAGCWAETGENLAAMRGTRLARRAAVALEASAERALAEAAFVDLSARVNSRTASFALCAADVAEALRDLRVGSPDQYGWLKAVQPAITLVREAGMDPDLMAVAAARLAEVQVAAPPQVAEAEPASPFGSIYNIVRAANRQIPVQLAWCQARHAAEAGLAADAQRRLTEALTHAEAQGLTLLYATSMDDHNGKVQELDVRLLEALEHARAGGQGMLYVALLHDLDRKVEARTIATRLAKAGLHPDLAADMFLRLGDPQAARQALKGLDAQGWAGSPDRPWSEPARRAELAMQLGDPDTARTLSMQAVAAFERWQSRLGLDPWRSSATDHISVAGMYHVAVLAHLKLAKRRSGPDAARLEATAFALADRCRGVVVPLVHALEALPVGAARQAARRWLRAGSAWTATYEGLAEQVLADPAVTPPVARLRSEVLAAEEELEAAEAGVAKLAPQLLTVGAEPAGIGDLATVRRHLSEESALVLYQTLDDDLLIWVVSRSRVRQYREPVRARDLAALARGFHTACSRGLDHQEYGERLAQLLVDRIADDVRDARRLLVVPHRALGLVPFHALARPWLDQIAVSYLPSAALVTRPEMPVRLDQPALLVGAPDRWATTAVPPLPGADTEIQTIARLLGTPDPLLGPAVTAARVTAQAWGRPIVHFATHAFVSERSPNRGYLALRGDDRLSVPDLMGLDIAADLLVLSACQTGRGTATAGGDVNGLVRAAVAQGTRNLIVSLWPVDDEAACLLMTSLYEELHATGGAHVGEALAAAQRRVRAMDTAGRSQAYGRLGGQRSVTSATQPVAREANPLYRPPAGDTTLPYHWAPFIHVGV